MTDLSEVVDNGGKKLDKELSASCKKMADLRPQIEQSFKDEEAELQRLEAEVAQIEAECGSMEQSIQSSEVELAKAQEDQRILEKQVTKVENILMEL